MTLYKPGTQFLYKGRTVSVDYIDAFYNRTRSHSHLGGISPRRLNAPRLEVLGRLLDRE